MNNFRNKRRNRRYTSYVSIFGTTQIHLRNPLTICLWSAAYPGFGHLLLNKYLRGYALVIWEMFINQRIRLNEAIVYSFNGQFQAARDVIDLRFMYLYIPVYLFAIWDSYRTTVDLNKIYLLASRENAPYSTFAIGAVEINHLDKRKPWVAAVWSMGIPSVGQLYLHRIFLAVFILLNTIILVYYSGILTSLHYLVLGDLRHAKSVVNAQWLLYIPSFYFFTIYDAYVNTVENNKLFDKELMDYLKRNYQPAGTIIKVGETVTDANLCDV